MHKNKHAKTTYFILFLALYNLFDFMDHRDMLNPAGENVLEKVLGMDRTANQTY